MYNCINFFLNRKIIHISFHYLDELVDDIHTNPSKFTHNKAIKEQIFRPAPQFVQPVKFIITYTRLYLKLFLDISAL